MPNILDAINLASNCSFICNCPTKKYFKHSNIQKLQTCLQPVFLLTPSEDLTSLQLLLHNQPVREIRAYSQQLWQLYYRVVQFWVCNHLSWVRSGPRPVKTGWPPSGVKPRWRSEGAIWKSRTWKCSSDSLDWSYPRKAAIWKVKEGSKNMSHESCHPSQIVK